jgi:hypothetical protein
MSHQEKSAYPGHGGSFDIFGDQECYRRAKKERKVGSEIAEDCK